MLIIIHEPSPPCKICGKPAWHDILLCPSCAGEECARELLEEFRANLKANLHKNGG